MLGNLTKHWDIVTSRTQVSRAYEAFAKRHGLVPYITQHPPYWETSPESDVSLPQSMILCAAGKDDPNYLIHHSLPGFSKYKLHISIDLEDYSFSFYVPPTFEKQWFRSWFESLFRLLREEDLRLLLQYLSVEKSNDKRPVNVLLFFYPETPEEYQLMRDWFSVEPLFALTPYPERSLHDYLPKIKAFLHRAERVLENPPENRFLFLRWFNVYFLLGYWVFLVGPSSRFPVPLLERNTFLTRSLLDWIEEACGDVQTDLTSMTVGHLEFFPSAKMSNPMVFHFKVTSDQLGPEMHYFFNLPQASIELLGEKVICTLYSVSKLSWRFHFYNPM